MSKSYSILANIVAKTDSFDKAMKDASSKADGFAKNFATKTKAIGQGMQDVGKSMTTKITLPLAALATGAVKVGAGFQQSMANVSAISGATGNDLAKLEEKARQMGATTKFSA